MSEIEREWFEAYSALPSAEDAGRALAAELDAESRGEIEKANGIEIPAEVLEAAIRASYDDQPQWFSGTMTRPSEHRPKTFEECYGCGPLEHKESREEVELILRAALDALGATVERDWINHQGEPIYPAPSLDPTHSRIVTSWRRSPDE